MKICSGCKEQKPFENFSKGSGKFGLHNHCKACAKIARAKRYNLKREEERAQNRKWHQENKPWMDEEKREYLNAWRRNHDRRAESHRRRVLIEAAGTWTISEWMELCRAYDYKCLACGSLDITVDHVVPLSQGGSNTIDNLQPLCQSCNSKKGIQIIDYRW